MIGVFAIVPRNGEILLIKRGVEPHKGHWCPPGGIIDEGETPEEAVVRETKEETGLDVSVVKKLKEVTGPVTGGKHGVYLCTFDGGRLTSAPPETIDVRWVHHDDLSNYIIPSFMMELLQEIHFQ